MKWDPMTKPITPRIAMEIIGHEAIVRQAYKDSVGKWTWSVGLTNATGHRVTRYINKPATLERCLEVYVWALNNYANDVREVFAGFPLTEYQFGAAVSFHWNTGRIRRASWVKHLKEGRMDRVEDAFMEWKRPPEIVGRRRKECNLLLRGEWDGDGTAIEYTRVRKSYVPDWSSGVTVEVRHIIERILGGPVEVPQIREPVEIDMSPKPEAVTEDQKQTWPWWMRLLRAVVNFIIGEPASA